MFGLHKIGFLFLYTMPDGFVYGRSDGFGGEGTRFFRIF